MNHSRARAVAAYGKIQITQSMIKVELQHRTPAQGATITGEGPYVVRSAFREPATVCETAYTCTVERLDDGWRLVDLQTDR